MNHKLTSYLLQLLLLLVVYVPLHSQDLVQQSPSVSTVDIQDVAVQPNGNAVAVGNSGRLLTSSDYGATWVESTEYIPNSLRVAAVQGDNNRFLVGTFNGLYLSSDAGQTWSFVAINTDVRWYALPSVNALYVGNLSTLLKSTDGGQTWATISPNVPNVQWRGVSFVSDTRGWMLTSTGDVYRTTDGGATWALINTGTMTQEGTITFTDANTGYATSFQDLYKTTNGGMTWTLVKANAFGSYQDQLLVLDGQHLVSTQGGLGIYTSQDGGANWSSVSPLPYGYNYNYMASLPGGRVWLACDFGSIAFSDDFGSSFTDQQPGFKYYLNSVDFSNNLTGWCAGQSGAIVRTQDGGETWNEITNLPLNELMEPQYALEVKTYSYEEAVLASDRVINYTADGGQTWETRLSLGVSDGYIQDATTVGDRVFALSSTSSGPHVYASSDRGANWNSYPISPNFPFLTFLHFPTAQIGFAGGGSTEGQLFKTTDGGQQWEELASFSPNRLQFAHFLDENTGWAIPEAFSNVLYQTTDGGQTWTTVTLPANSFWRSFYAASATEWDVFGGSAGFGTMWRTTDAGQTWVQTIISYDSFFQDYARINAPNGHTYWLCGTAGYIGRIDFTNTFANSLTYFPLQLGPNPTTGILRIVLPTEEQGLDARLLLVDAAGRPCFDAPAREYADISHLPAGRYQCMLYVGERIYSQVVVKM